MHAAADDRLMGCGLNVNLAAPGYAHVVPPCAVMYPLEDSSLGV